MKTLEVELFGRKLKLYERKTVDVYTAYEFSKAHPEQDFKIRLMEFALMIRDSLKPNLKWYNKIFLSYKVNIDYLLKNLSPAQLLELVDKINELEGNKKKVTPEAANQSDGTPPPD